jgi:hypothetical protein
LFHDDKNVSPTAVGANGAIIVLRRYVALKIARNYARTTILIYISEFRGLELVSRITFAVFRRFKSQFKSRMPEEAFDSSADNSDDSVPGQFDEPDLMLDRVSRVVCGDEASSICSDE